MGWLDFYFEDPLKAQYRIHSELVNTDHSWRRGLPILGTLGSKNWSSRPWLFSLSHATGGIVLSPSRVSQVIPVIPRESFLWHWHSARSRQLHTVKLSAGGLMCGSQRWQTWSDSIPIAGGCRWHVYSCPSIVSSGREFPINVGSRLV